ncbi:MAG: amidohydrolase family protein [Candidatus Hydrothermarchaeota archaeon]
MSNPLIIDAHVHCGSKTIHYPIERIIENLDRLNIDGAVIFPFPEDQYRILDTPKSRIESNRYVLEKSRIKRHIYPFYFVWRDYIIPPNLEDYKGIKWHRHLNEPEYDYESKSCKKMLEKIKELGLPVNLEEEYENTVSFIEENADLNVIIPHIGMLNGGHIRVLEAFKRKKNVYFDTSLASRGIINYAIKLVGVDRILFGSDFPYGSQEYELKKILDLDLKRKEFEKILSGNILRLIEG